MPRESPFDKWQTQSPDDPESQYCPSCGKYFSAEEMQIFCKKCDKEFTKIAKVMK